MKPYDGWSEHNKALKNPEYQMEGMMDCLREETMMNMPVYEEPVREIEPIIPETNFYRQVEYLRSGCAKGGNFHRAAKREWIACGIQRW